MTGEVTLAGLTMWLVAWAGAYVVTLLADSSAREHLMMAPLRRTMVETELDLKRRGIEVRSFWWTTGWVRRRVAVIMVIPAAELLLGLLALRLGAPVAAVAVAVGTLLAGYGAADHAILRRRGYHTRSDMGRATTGLVFLARTIIVCSAVALVFEGWSRELGRLVGRARGARRGTAGRVGRPPTGHMGRATGAQEGSRGVRAGRDPRGAALPPRVRRRRHPSAHPVSVTGLVRSVLPFPSVRFEEALTAHLVRNGELVTAGRPDENLPELGATRTYLPHDGWQGSVRETAHRCQAIFLLGGLTNSLSWEIQQLRDWGMLGKTLILLPPDPDAQRSLQRLQLIEELLGLEPIESEHWLYPGWVAVGWQPHGKAVYYLSVGRDWAEYLGVITTFLASLSGRRRSEPAPAEPASSTKAPRPTAGLDALAEANRRTLEAYAERQASQRLDGGAE